ncbi:AfsR/SARP family transcriptional regulator [Blastococcus sp. TF02A-26]|uniref:AfsR/SARP family transcriptional regulator n=1 Tax=Blastococcus sp. TF02A-26 TaxID=2250577 RepID=UPI0013144BD9|nr:AfsR/SARP family transcriptional regulator [Blastococcus sp. TF02A-26]
MLYRVLGPLEVTDDAGRPLDLGGAKPRTLLTLLLSEPGRAVGLDRIVTTLWGDEPPPTVTGTLQAYVSHLRRVLEPERGPREAPRVLLTRPPGYAIAVPDDALDSLRFARFLEDGDAAVTAGDPARGGALLDQALELWRGEPLPELGDAPEAAAERLRLTELHVRARERRCEALLDAGRPEAAVPDLQRLVAEHPLRERLWARLVTALYAADRQADALDALRRCATLLRDELGIDPGPELRELERAVLRQDPALRREPAVSRPRPPAPPAPPVPAAPAAPAETLVGREIELAQLRVSLDLAAGGRPGVVVVGGEAGIGKTRLAEAAADVARAAGWAVAWSRCADDAGAPALWPWTQVLSALGQERLPPPPADDDADDARFRLFEELCSRLTAAAGRQPLLVVLDDLQGADTASVQLLSLLTRHLPRLPLLLLVTVRDVGEELPPAVADCLARLGREPSASRLRLDGLEAAEVAELLAARLGPDPDPALASTVHDRTAGNPFFVVELTRWMAGAADPARMAVPPSVGAVLHTRLDRLPAATRAVLELAALAGREISLGLLEAAGAPAEEALPALESAMALGLVVPGSTPWSWRFTHALVQEVLAAELGVLDRARLHARLGTALEQGGTGDDTVLERLAHHFVEAVPVTGTGPARRWSVAAAEAARARLAHGEAAAHTRRALRLVDPAEPDAARTRHDLLTALGDDLLRSGRRTEAQEVLGEAIAVARQLGDRRCLLEAASVWGSPTLWNWRPHGVVDHGMVALLEELLEHREEIAPDASPPEAGRLTARLLGTLGVELAYSEDLQRGPRYAERAVQVAREVGDPELLGRVLDNYALAVWGRPGAAELRLAAADEALALAGAGLPRRTEFHARVHRAAIRLHLTDRRGFEQDLDAAARLAASLSGPEIRPHVLWQQAGAAWLRGDAERAEELTTEAHELFRAITPHAGHAYAAHQFVLRRAAGRPGDALDLLVATGDEGHPLLQLMAVLAAAEAGDLAEARRLRRRWGRTQVRDWASDVAVLLETEVALLLGDEPELEMAVVQVLPFRGRQAVLGTPAFSLGSYDETLGRVAERQGDTVAAREWWQAALRQGRAVGSPRQVAVAEAHLARVPESAARRPSRRR